VDSNAPKWKEAAMGLIDTLKDVGDVVLKIDNIKWQNTVKPT